LLFDWLRLSEGDSVNFDSCVGLHTPVTGSKYHFRSAAATVEEV